VNVDPLCIRHIPSIRRNPRALHQSLYNPPRLVFRVQAWFRVEGLRFMMQGLGFGV